MIHEIYLSRFLQMPCIVLLNVMPRADGGFQLVSHHHAWSLGGRPANEKHHTSPRVWECPLRKKQELDFSDQTLYHIISLVHHKRMNKSLCSIFMNTVDG